MIVKQQKEWFDRLRESQLEDVKVFMKPKYFNVFNGVIDKYSDSAHFIFELLQNADDAGATEVLMELYPDKFIFTHNGKVRFTISNPETEEEDRVNGKLGHINSICSIGFSSKNYETEIRENKIGKFGVGFKAVFQYTSTPEVYDNPFCFRIDDYIVPSIIDNPRYQKSGQTVFVIPFNRKEISPQGAFEEISQKLMNLNYPQLFLNNIKSITWETPTDKGEIVKKLDIEGYSHGIRYKLNSLRNSFNDERKKILLLSRPIEVPNHGKHDVTIGYYIERGRIITSESQNIHCFFPTNENIGTCYVIHAPFALVDNRQQIKRYDDVNYFLFNAIAELAADGLLVLRDWNGYDKAKLLNDNIIKLIQYNTESFDNGRLYNKIDGCFQKCFERILENEPVFLSRTGEYLTKATSFWADEEIRDLLDDTQLNSLILYSKDDLNRYGFVLCSVKNSDLTSSGIVLNKFDGELFAKRITSNFMKEQPFEWLDRFYKFVKSKRLLICKGKWSKAPMQYAKIIKLQTGEYTSPYNSTNEIQVFVDDGTIDPGNCVNISLLESCESFRDIINDLKIHIPNQLDKLKIQIEKHQEFSREKNNDLLVSIIRYYNSLEGGWDKKDFLQLVRKGYAFYAVDMHTNETHWAYCGQIYEDNSLIKEYYAASGLRDWFLIDESYYKNAIESVGEILFNDFINDFGVIRRPAYSRISVDLNKTELKNRQHRTYTDKNISMINGLDKILSKTINVPISEHLSHYIWDLIIYYSKNRPNFYDNDISLYSWHSKQYKRDWGKSTMLDAIRNAKWLYIDGKYKSLQDGVYKEDLIENGYHGEDSIFQNLKIESRPDLIEAEIIKGMSPEIQRDFALVQELRKLGIRGIDEIKSLIGQVEAYRRKDTIAQMERQARAERRKQEADAFNELPSRKKSSGVKAADFDAPDNERARSSIGNSSTAGKSIDEILEGFAEKAMVEKEEFEAVVNLRERIAQSEKYSYDWLTSLMQLEVRSQGDERAAGKKALYISFEHISVNPKNDRMIVLSGPSRYIPMSLEEMDDIPVTFVFKNGTEDTIKFESISVKEDSVILIHKTEVINAIRKNINSISYVFTEINEPIELLSEWQRRINAMDFEPTDSIKAKLRKDIEFIFGPPGTGKTTTLARRIYEIISRDESDMKILVLAPTNKACDVLTHKLLEVAKGNNAWIWRFEKTDDPYLEEQDVVHKRTCNVSDQGKVCVISTIARYAFDGFEDGYLRDLNWNYVFIDEASMIPLYQIVPPLYNPLSKRIIVSGDPFQIEPIVNIDLWKGENIYKMINLHDFASPTTEPEQFKVTTLMTQYRSIPRIGELFSSYLYGGKLQHNREDSQHRILNMGIKENPLNIISFPVGKESIFDLKRLSGSNIQIYSIIFTIEFLKYITKNLNDHHNNDAEPIKIGVISPYSAQIQAIEKIYNQSCPFYDNIDVIFGSAHGFQGDQCDIIIAVMNPPSSGLKRAADMTFINNKNILNVAISRASDYLFLLIPEKDYENFNSLFEIKKIGRKMNELRSEIYSNDMVENILFSESNHIERITYVTSHKMTNVFNNPFSHYEVRIDESAIDIQINDF